MMCVCPEDVNLWDIYSLWQLTSRVEKTSWDMWVQRKRRRQGDPCSFLGTQSVATAGLDVKASSFPRILLTPRVIAGSTSPGSRPSNLLIMNHLSNRACVYSTSGFSVEHFISKRHSDNSVGSSCLSPSPPKIPDSDKNLPCGQLIWRLDTYSEPHCWSNDLEGNKLISNYALPLAGVLNKATAGLLLTQCIFLP